MAKDFSKKQIDGRGSLVSKFLEHIWIYFIRLAALSERNLESNLLILFTSMELMSMTG